MRNRKSVILRGLGKDFLDIYIFIKTCMNVVGISDADCKKGMQIARTLNTQFYTTDELSDLNVDCIYVCTATKERYLEIFRELVYRYGVKRESILYYKDFYKEICVRNGNKGDKEIYVLRLGKNMGGIGTLLVFFVSQIISLPECVDYYVDMKNYRNVYLTDDDLGKINAWEYWFEQPCGMSDGDPYLNQNIILGGAEEYALDYLKFWTDLDLERRVSQKFRKTFRFNSAMKKILDDERKKLKFDGKDTCAVIYRGTDYTFLKTYHHSIQPTIDEMIEKIYEMKSKWGFKKIYLSTEDAKAYKRFREEFGSDMLFSERALVDQYPLNESKTYSPDDRGALSNVSFDRPDDPFLKGMEYLRQMALASECDYIISGNTGGYWCTLLMSKGFRGKYCFELGIYGEDDDSYATPIGHYVLIEEEKRVEKERKALVSRKKTVVNG